MDYKWYVLRVYSGHENKVKSNLLNEIENNDELKAKIAEILVPEEKVFEVKNGKKKTKTKKFFPGYILINADLDANVKEFILNTPSVMGFLGTGKNPTPLPKEDVKKIIGKIEQELSGEKVETAYKAGDQVKIIEGPFKEFVGFIQEVNIEKMKIKVMISIFGRQTPVEIDFAQAELVNK
jgi:transcriptional antiterminator NusG